jgi:hypothetical protein
VTDFHVVNEPEKCNLLAIHQTFTGCRRAPSARTLYHRTPGRSLIFPLFNF